MQLARHEEHSAEVKAEAIEHGWYWLGGVPADQAKALKAEGLVRRIVKTGTKGRKVFAAAGQAGFDALLAIHTERLANPATLTYARSHGFPEKPKATPKPTADVVVDSATGESLTDRITAVKFALDNKLVSQADAKKLAKEVLGL